MRLAPLACASVLQHSYMHASKRDLSLHLGQLPLTALGRLAESFLDFLMCHVVWGRLIVG